MIELVILAFLLTLLYTAYLDWKYRLVPKIVWIPVILIGLPISLWDYWSIASLNQIVPMVILMIALYILGLKKIIGGADALGMIFLIAFLHEYGLITILLACMFCYPFILYSYSAYKKEWTKYGIPFMIPLAMGYIITIWYFLT